MLSNGRKEWSSFATEWAPGVIDISRPWLNTGKEKTKLQPGEKPLKMPKAKPVSGLSKRARVEKRKVASLNLTWRSCCRSWAKWLAHCRVFLILSRGVRTGFFSSWDLIMKVTEIIYRLTCYMCAYGSAWIHMNWRGWFEFSLSLTSSWNRWRWELFAVSAQYAQSSANAASSAAPCAEDCVDCAWLQHAFAAWDLNFKWMKWSLRVSGVSFWRRSLRSVQTLTLQRTRWWFEDLGHRLELTKTELIGCQCKAFLLEPKAIYHVTVSCKIVRARGGVFTSEYAWLLQPEPEENEEAGLVAAEAPEECLTTLFLDRILAGYLWLGVCADGNEIV